MINVFTDTDVMRHRNSAKLLREQLDCQGPDSTWDFGFDEIESKRTHADWHDSMADRIENVMLQELPIKSSTYRAVDGSYTIRVPGSQGVAYPSAVGKGATLRAAIVDLGTESENGAGDANS